MYFYHLSVKIIGRSKGRSAVACAAYRSGQRLEDERYALVHDYAPRQGITQTGIIAPDKAPAWALDREKLWNRVEAGEKRKDAQLARDFTLALPSQVSAEVRTELVETFIREQLIPRGAIVDYAIHSPNRKGDERNFHAHLMTTMRPLQGGEFSKKKDRTVNNRKTVRAWREAWSDLQNHTFERLQIRDEGGSILRVDHRSYKRRGIDRDPTLHMGVTATALEREGTPTEIGDMNRTIQRVNDEREILMQMIRKLDREERELIAQERRSDRNRDFDR